MSSPASGIQAGDIARPHGEIPFLRIPERAVFRDRAARLRTLAQGHGMRDFLLLMGHVCDAQQAVLDAFPEVPLPDGARLDLCRAHCMPPLPVQGWQRHPAWRAALRQIAAHVEQHAPSQPRDALARVRQMDDVALEMLAGAILSGNYARADLGAAPFAAAALQVYWTHMTSALGTGAFGRGDIVNLCPACGSPPVASIVRIGGAEQGVRYLSCSLCGVQWHMVRVKCSNCDSTKGIGYHAIEGASGAMKAESCDACDSYLKIAYMDKDFCVDPVADDLATLALDLLMDDAGKSRSGPNLFLMMTQD